MLIAQADDRDNDTHSRGRGRRNPTHGDDPSYLRVFAVRTADDGSAASAVWPIEPEPFECQAAPRPLSFFAPDALLLLATPGTDVTAPLLPSPLDRQPGAPANPAVVAAVISVLREAAACAEAADFLRLSALLTDEAAHRAAVHGLGPYIPSFGDRRRSSDDSDATPESISRQITGMNHPVPEEDQFQHFTVSNVQERPDGSVTVVTVRTASDGSEHRTIAMFAREGNRLLIADEDNVQVAGTPVP